MKCKIYENKSKCNIPYNLKPFVALKLTNRFYILFVRSEDDEEPRNMNKKKQGNMWKEWLKEMRK